MWEIVMAIQIWSAPLSPPDTPQKPPHYVACIDGHIAANLSECPPPSRHPPNPYGRGPIGGGPTGDGGLLGGIGGLLGGVGGLL